MLIEEKIMNSVGIFATVTCSFCGKEEEYEIKKGTETNILIPISEKLREEGWDHLKSAKKTYLACPDCLGNEEEGD